MAKKRRSKSPLYTTVAVEVSEWRVGKGGYADHVRSERQQVGQYGVYDDALKFADELVDKAHDIGEQG